MIIFIELTRYVNKVLNETTSSAKLFHLPINSFNNIILQLRDGGRNANSGAGDEINLENGFKVLIKYAYGCTVVVARLLEHPLSRLD